MFNERSMTEEESAEIPWANATNDQTEIPWANAEDKTNITGTAMGVSQIIVGHPFDTIKVLMQNKQKWFGLPIKNYYNGWRYPLFFKLSQMPIHL